MRILALIAATFVIGQSNAQLEFDFNNRHLPQSAVANPAFLPQYKFNLGFSSSNLFMLNRCNLNTFFNPNETDSMSIANAMKSSFSQFGAEFTSKSDLLHFGIRSKKAYFGFNSSMVFEGALFIPRDLLGLLYFGNGAFIGKTADIDFGGTQFTSYLKNQITYGRQINNELSIGVNLAYLNGISNFAINKGYVHLKTDTGVASIYQITMASEIDAQTSMMGIDPTRMLDQAYSTNAGTIFQDGLKGTSLSTNRGYSIDIGAVYRINEKFRVSASIQNFGNINWSTGAMTHKMPYASYIFKGLDTTQFKQFQKNDSNSIFDQIADTFDATFVRTSSNVSSYNSKLKPRYTIGVEFFPFKRTNVQFIFGTGYGVLGDKSFISTGIHQEIGEIMDIRAMYTLYDFSYPQHRIGVGTSLNLGIIQPFINISDVLGAVNYATANTISGTLGVNFMIGMQKDKDNDGIPDKRDSCRKVFGVLSNNGCPYGFLGESMNNENEITPEQPAFEIVPADSVSDPSKAKPTSTPIPKETKLETTNPTPTPSNPSTNPTNPSNPPNPTNPSNPSFQSRSKTYDLKVAEMTEIMKK